MNRSRLKLVHKRKPQEDDDFSFMPPYAEQAKYLMLADKFLALNGTHSSGEKVVSIEHEEKNLQSKKREAA